MSDQRKEVVVSLADRRQTGFLAGDTTLIEGNRL